MKFDRQLRPAIETSWVVSYGGKTIPRWRTAAILKILISTYLSEKIIRFWWNFVHSSIFWTGWTLRCACTNEKVALDRLRVRQNVFLVIVVIFVYHNQHGRPRRREENRIYLYAAVKLKRKYNYNRRLRSTYCTSETNYWQTRRIARPLCDSRTTCSVLVLLSCVQTNKASRHSAGRAEK